MGYKGKKKSWISKTMQQVLFSSALWGRLQTFMSVENPFGTRQSITPAHLSAAQAPRQKKTVHCQRVLSTFLRHLLGP